MTIKLAPTCLAPIAAASFLCAPYLIEAQDDWELVVSVPHGNYGTTESVAIRGKLDGFGSYWVRLGAVPDSEDGKMAIESSYSGPIRFVLHHGWLLDGTSSVFEKNGQIFAIMGIEGPEQQCKNIDEGFDLWLPLVSEGELPGQIVEAFGCGTDDVAVELDR